MVLGAKQRTASAEWLSQATEAAELANMNLLLAVDLGSTNLKLALVNEANWQVLAEAQVSNEQKALGADILSRLHFTQEHAEGGRLLQQLVVKSLHHGFRLLQEQTPGPLVPARVAVAGNSVMLALLLGMSPPVGVDIATAVRSYLESPLQVNDLGLKLGAATQFCLMPPLASYVGSDMLACVLATDLAQATEPALIIDIGTNVELALGTTERIYVCSTAAGPAFEGAEISCGMSATAGAIHTVTWEGGSYRVQTIAGAPAVGICGSGLFSAVATARKHHQVDASGRLADEVLQLTPDVALTQQDVRRFQLAKAAVRTGIDLLLAEARLPAAAVASVYVAGDFGKHVAIPDLIACGLLPDVLDDRVRKIDRGCIAGIIEYCRHETDALAELLASITHIELAAQSSFQERFISNMQIGQVATSGEGE